MSHFGSLGNFKTISGLQTISTAGALNIAPLDQDQTLNLVYYNHETGKITYDVAPPDAVTTWIDPNLVNQVPKVIFETSKQYSDTENIVIPWKYPTQINVGFLGQNLPLLQNLYVSYFSTATTPPIEVPVITKNTDMSGFFNNFSTGYDKGVSGVILTNIRPQTGRDVIPGIYPYTNKDNTDTRFYYFFYDANLKSNIQPGTQTTCNVYYSNYSNVKPVQSVTTISGLIDPGVPGPPLFISVTNTTINRILVSTWTFPLKSDTTNNVDGNINTIKSYYFYYTSTSQPEHRIGASLSPDVSSPVLVTPGNPNTTKNTPPLRPETLYTVSVYAVNKTNLTANPQGAIATYQEVRTGTDLSNDSPISGSDLFSISEKPGKPVTGTYNYKLITVLPSTTTISAPIQVFNTRGNLGTTSPIMVLSSSYIKNSVTVSGPTVSYTGFSPSPSSASAGNITITPGSTTDKYPPAEASKQGYYQNASVTMTINSSVFEPSPSPYIINLVQTINSTSYPKNVSFYYDGNDTAPGVTGTPTLTLTGGTPQYVSGVQICKGDPRFSVTTTGVTKMGTYFYNKDQIAKYKITFTAGNYSGGDISSGSGLSDVTTQYGVSLPSSIDITSTLPFTSLLATSITVKPTFYNVQGNVDGNDTPILYFVSDPTYIKDTAIRDVTSPSTVRGCRISSGPKTPLYITSPANPDPDYPRDSVTGYNNPGNPVIYDDTMDITNTNELQYTNGGYTTPGVNKSYLDYTSYKYYNVGQQVNAGPNYSLIPKTGYRFATFAWKIKTGFAFNGLKFVINNFTSTFTPTGFPLKINDKALYVYYRFDEPGTPIPNSSTAATSVWADANRGDSSNKGGIQNFSDATHADNSTVPIQILSGYITNSFPVVNAGAKTITFTVTKIVIPADTYLYCRIGLPMTEEFSFENVTAIFS